MYLLQKRIKCFHSPMLRKTHTFIGNDLQCYRLFRYNALLFIIACIMSRDSTVSIVTRLWFGRPTDRLSIAGRCNAFHTGSVAHPASYSMNTGPSYSGSTAAKSCSWPLNSTSIDNNGWRYTSTSTYAFLTCNGRAVPLLNLTNTCISYSKLNL